MRLENIIWGLVGAAIGSATTYVITKKVIQARCDAEIKAYKDHIEKKINDLEAEIADHENMKEEAINHTEEQEKPKASIQDLSDNVDKAYKEYVRTRENIKWQGHMSVDEALETGDPELIQQAEWLEKRDKMEKEGVFKGQDGSPQVISQLAYSGEGEGEYEYHEDYQHISLDWYAKDGVLAYGHNCEILGEGHEINEYIEKPGFLIGWDWKQHFGDEELYNDADTVYVRNDYIKCDFEILRDVGSYKEIILGYDDSEEESEDDGNKE